MAATKAGPVTAGQLKSFVERIERLEEERKVIGGDVKDIYSEVKGVGYDVKTVRKIIQMRAKDSAKLAEEETLLDVYKHALGMESHGLEEQANDRALARLREIDRCMRLSNGNEPPRIDAIMRELNCSSGKASAIRKACEQRLKERVSISSSVSSNEIETAHDPDTGEIEPAAERSLADKVEGALADAGFVREPGTNNFSTTLKAGAADEDDDLEPPPFLKRARVLHA